MLILWSENVIKNLKYVVATSVKKPQNSLIFFNKRLKIQILLL